MTCYPLKSSWTDTEHQWRWNVQEIWTALLGGMTGLAAASMAAQFGLRLADRMPGESFMPECFYCLRPAAAYEMIPVFGWLLRTHAMRLPCPCGQKSWQWPVPAAEISGLIAGLALGALGGFDAGVIWLYLVCGLLPAIAVVDLLFGIIPDIFNIALALLGVAWLLSGGGAVTAGLMLGGILLLLGLFLSHGYSAIRRKEMLGLGDVKFFAAAGLWLQPDLLPWFLVMAGVFGAVFALIWRRFGGDEQAPFAPALCLSLFFCILARIISGQ